MISSREGTRGQGQGTQPRRVVAAAALAAVRIQRSRLDALDRCGGALASVIRHSVFEPDAFSGRLCCPTVLHSPKEEGSTIGHPQEDARHLLFLVVCLVCTADSARAVVASVVPICKCFSPSLRCTIFITFHNRRKMSTTMSQAPSTPLTSRIMNKHCVYTPRQRDPAKFSKNKCLPKLFGNVNTAAADNRCE